VIFRISGGNTKKYGQVQQDQDEVAVVITQGHQFPPKTKKCNWFEYVSSRTDGMESTHKVVGRVTLGEAVHQQSLPIHF